MQDVSKVDIRIKHVSVLNCRDGRHGKAPAQGLNEKEAGLF